MCRLYGFVATEPTGLECSLIEAQNALLIQSDRDMRGLRNPDGWGIATWKEGLPVLTKSTMPAFADGSFRAAASSVQGKAVVAHIRRATIGQVGLENTHPFQHGPWIFAHNGTIHPFEHVRTHLDLNAFGPPHGGTDSEAVFLWLLERMGQHGLSPAEPARELGPIVDLLHDAVLELVQVSLRAGATAEPTLNFLLSDGKHLAASRWGKTLYWTYRRGVTDCMVCGSSHCPDADHRYRAVVVASEPITNEDWNEIPEGTVFGASPEIATLARSLVGPTSLTA